MKRYRLITLDEQIEHEIKKHSAKDKIQKTINRTPKRVKHIALIKKHFPDCKKIICIGARHDSEVKSFLKHGFNAIGIDVAAGSEYIKRIDAHRLCTVFKKNEFDLAYCSHVLEHMYDARKVLRCIRRIASQGIFVTLPIYDKVRGMDASHCTIYNIMINPDKLDLKDFDDLQPYKLLFFERREREFDFILDFRIWKKKSIKLC